MLAVAIVTDTRWHHGHKSRKHSHHSVYWSFQIYIPWPWDNKDRSLWLMVSCEDETVIKSVYPWYCSIGRLILTIVKWHGSTAYWNTINSVYINYNENSTIQYTPNPTLYLLLLTWSTFLHIPGTYPQPLIPFSKPFPKTHTHTHTHTHLQSARIISHPSSSHTHISAPTHHPPVQHSRDTFPRSQNRSHGSHHYTPGYWGILPRTPPGLNTWHSSYSWGGWQTSRLNVHYRTDLKNETVQNFAKMIK